jgi:subtilisin family serine protease
MKRLVFVSALGIVGGVGAVGCATGGPPSDSEPVELAPSAVAQIEALLAEKDARTPAQRKIGSQLLYARDGRFQVPETKDGAFRSLAPSDAQGRVLVDIAGTLDRAKMTSLGGSVVDARPGHMRAWIALAHVEELADDAAVMSVQPALMARTWRADAPAPVWRERVEHPPAVGFAAMAGPGAVKSEGSMAHAADRARKWFATDGSGVSVGVLSDSDDHLEEAIASGDLPADTTTLPGQSGRPGAGEGTAMMEIVHDVAPGAKLYFATAFGSAQAFADNIRALHFQYGCKIIVDDVGYFAESPYQDDIIARAIEDVTADGALYFTAAGNEGNLDDGTSGTWEGDFRAGGTLATLPGGYTVHDFGNKAISDRIEKTGGPLILQWSDPSTLDMPASTNDYDLFVLDKDLRNVIVASTDVQDGTKTPFEALAYSIPPDYRVVIAKKDSAAPRALRLQHAGGELGIATAGSIGGHPAAQDAIAVAAVDVREAGGGEFAAGVTTPVELFSSDGNRRIFYDATGALIGTGATLASTGGLTRKKPDLAGADGVMTTLPGTSGLNPFFGTSAAAPHVAGVAALLVSAAPTATTTKVRDSLRLGALDIEAGGVDRNAGSGIASAMNGLTRVGAVKSAFLEIESVVAFPDSGASIRPGGAGHLAIRLANHGGATATAISATLTSGSPDVTITQATTTFPSAASGGFTNAATQLAFTVAPTATCGAALPLKLTVAFTGAGIHPTVLDFAVQTGAPSAAPTVTSYTGPAVAIPDGNATGVDIPLAVTAAGPLAKLRLRFDGATCTPNAGATTVGLDHTWVGDLTMTLRSPAGRVVTLASRPGGTLNGGNNFCGTVFDDASTASIQTVLATAAPYTGTFDPFEALGAFAGQPIAGTWTLHVSDAVLSDSGSVRAFSLETTGYVCN